MARLKLLCKIPCLWLHITLVALLSARYHLSLRSTLALLDDIVLVMGLRLSGRRFGPTSAADILSGQCPSGYSLSVYEYLVRHLKRFTAAVELFAFVLGNGTTGTVLF